MLGDWTNTLVIVLLLGAIEGLTEFLPVSSTGHLILAADLCGFDALFGDEQAKTFEIVIQLGAILAVVAAYPHRFRQLLRVRDGTGFTGWRGLWLLFLTTVPAGIAGLLAHRVIKDVLFQPLTVAMGLALGGMWILAIERWPVGVRRRGLDSLGWRDALAVGLFQCLALWPGMSRSSSTIVGGMMLGIERRTAAEYSFFAAVPLLTAACSYELYKNRATLSADHAPWLAIGFVVSFLVAWFAVRGFVRFLGRHTLTAFGWYRVVVATFAALRSLCV